jgi:hypothetical protein
MELVANIVGLVVVAMIAALVIALSNKYSWMRMAASHAMGKLNVPWIQISTLISSLH